MEVNVHRGRREKRDAGKETWISPEIRNLGDGEELARKIDNSKPISQEKGIPNAEREINQGRDN